MGQAPKRAVPAYFVGAGLSCAFGLPNTAALLNSVKQRLDSELSAAFSALYPDGHRQNYLPDTVDFFSSLQAFCDLVGPGMAGTKLTDAKGLMQKLKLEIARLLIKRMRDADTPGFSRNEYLAAMIRSGNVIVTTNWDLVIERFAQVNEIPIKLSGPPDKGHVLLLKLHGSVDWSERKHIKRKEYLAADYANLREKKTKMILPTAERAVIRIRLLEHWKRAWQRLGSRTAEPFLITMYRGKGPEVQAISEVWADAYKAICRASSLDIVGYSLPADDLEIRTLLRAALTRGQQEVKVLIRNPAPEVHSRIRHHLDAEADSDYRAI